MQPWNLRRVQGFQSAQQLIKEGRGPHGEQRIRMRIYRNENIFRNVPSADRLTYKTHCQNQRTTSRSNMEPMYETDSAHVVDTARPKSCGVTRNRRLVHGQQVLLSVCTWKIEVLRTLALLGNRVYFHFFTEQFKNNISIHTILIHTNSQLTTTLRTSHARLNI